MQPIGPLPGHTTAAATAVSDNGKIVVGISNSTFLQYQGVVLGWNPGTAFRWAESGSNAGIKDLRDLLIANGVNMTGITLLSVTGMSPDGQWIQGQAQAPTGETTFVAQICDEAIGGPCSTDGTAPFTLGATPNQLTVSAGNSGTATITVTPDAGFSQPVSFACGNLPPGAACSFNPPSVTPAGGPINTVLTITTNGGPVASLPSGPPATMFAALFAPIVLFPAGFLMRRSGTGRGLFSLLSGCVIMLAVAGLLSCGGSDSSTPATNSGGGAATGTPAGTSTVSVTASSSAGNTGVPVTLTVTRP
ncbi:hypothetical protein YTPLAS18_13510 [Nitrospira sp.]|nr:hypothetical protein YTPLAS18_13510 [Nitrospira sp.]